MRIAIIGAGINGVFNAWMLSKSNYDVDIYESGKALRKTSSSSSKLIHGGIRYLEHGHIRLVQESLNDRHWWLQHAPKHCKPIKIYIPVYKSSPRSLYKLYVGAKFYNLLSGKYSLGPSRYISHSDMITIDKKLLSKDLLGCISFYDAQMHEENLGNWVLNSALESGARLFENTVIEKLDTSGSISSRSFGSRNYDLVINAAGPWASSLNEKSYINTDYYLRLIRGSHIILNKQHKMNNSYFFQNETDNRMVFIISYQGKTLIGTTEVEQEINDQAKCSEDERNYLIGVYNKHFIDKICENDISFEFSGLRPIVSSKNEYKKTYFSFASREAKIEKIGNLITLYGGKWTSAPSLSRKLLNKIKKL